MKPTLFIFFVCALLGLKNCADRYQHEAHWKDALHLAHDSLSPAQFVEFIERNEGEPEPWVWPAVNLPAGAALFPTPTGHSSLHAIAFVHDGKRKVIQTTEVNQ